MVLCTKNSDISKAASVKKPKKERDTRKEFEEAHPEICFGKFISKLNH